MISPDSTSEYPAAHWPGPLIDLLERQHALVDRLVDLARAQASLIAERKTDRLLDLLAQRQSIIDEFTASQQQMTKMTEGLEGRLKGVAHTHRERIRSLINDIGDRLGEIMQRDQQDQANLRFGRYQTRVVLQGVGAVRAAHSAYAVAPHAVGPSRFADHRG
jgi:hypothetical protein